MSDIEFTLRTARTLFPVIPITATELINRVKIETVDKKLQTRIDWVIEAMTRADQEAALRWLDRAIEYIATAPTGVARTTGIRGAPRTWHCKAIGEIITLRPHLGEER